ncbi:TRAP transporter large permease [Irregularibacter muris]|jgi:tripartite ATP-independent transporter DctM subunit|uniref:TRAP transporter large permease n=1 Tax=Irregularibacter muris TaxID=1796619 RepID=A0AAE3L2V5_9FIRM|nr:TRAP transporter large permease [Irregularibacter muris]MCR1899369.1 TRAP transporter large permease [Irregularibacter muris]
MILVIFIGVLVALFLIGASIPWAIGLTSMIVMLIESGFNGNLFGTMVQKMVAGTNNFTLLAIPFFLLAAKLMNVGSITKKIFRLCNGLVGWIPGGLGHANIAASIIFAGMSGAAVADASGLGTIEVEAMANEGFDREFSAAVTAASSTVGPIIPPSINLVVFGVAGGVSISKLLIAGVIPGLLMGLTMMVMVYYFAIKRGYPRRKFPTLREFWELISDAFFPILTPVILIGGITIGIFTPTEAAAIAALYAFILTVIVYREITLKQFIVVIKETVRETCAIMIIVAASSLFGYLLIKTQIPNILLENLFVLTQNKYLILLLLNLFLLVIGCFMETNSAIMILTPIILPITTMLGIDPIQIGIIMILNLMIGLLTPPIGMCLYATARVARIKLETMIKAIIPWYIPLGVSLLIVTYVPIISLWLPSLIKL